MGQDFSGCCSCGGNAHNNDIVQGPDSQHNEDETDSLPPKGSRPPRPGPHRRDDTVPGLEITLHHVHLQRSFVSFSWTSPAAIIMADGKQVARIVPEKWSPKEPKWQSNCRHKLKALPRTISLAIFDKNSGDKDVLLGSVTVPCDAEMGHLERRDFTLTKRQKPIGMASLSIRVSADSAAKECAAEAISRTTSIGGMEYDNVAAWSRGKSRDESIQLKEPAEITAATAAANVEEDREIETTGAPAAAASPAKAHVAKADVRQVSAPTSVAPPAAAPAAAPADDGIPHPIIGVWKCVETRGLDDFLKATGVGMFQRKIANAARWPGWEYTLKGDRVLFINKSAIGDLKEEFPMRKEYSWKDGHGNALTCKAEWQPAPDGGTLLTTRSGSIGSFKEERKVVGNRLVFTLTHGTGVSWGRTFERER